MDFTSDDVTIQWVQLHEFYYTSLTSAKEYSKLAVHLWTNNLAKRLTAENSKVMVLLAHPGPILSVSFLTFNFPTLLLPVFPFSLRMVLSAI